MIALGIDPGTRRVGYGVIKEKNGELKLLAAGLLEIGKEKGPEALKGTALDLKRLIRKFKPDVLSVEKLYFAKNQKTAIAVAQARGVILLTAAEEGLKIKECSPNEVKTAITGYGLADKKAVLKMVRLILKEPGLDVIDDASDALALAILSTSKGI